MAFLGILMAVYALLITPIHIRADLAAGAHLSGALIFRAWGLRLQSNVGLIRDEAGKLTVAVRFKGSPKQHSGGIAEIWQRFYALFHLLGRTEIFSRIVTVLYVGLSVRVSFPDAAKTALSAGAAEVLMDIGRKVLKTHGIPCSLKAWPDFTGKPCAAQLTCILFMRLGTLLYGYAMASFAVWAAKKRNRKEERTWSTPSET